jgi:protein disulfide-isomerase A6
MEQSFVTILTNENFNLEVYGSENQWLIMFFAPWCEKSKDLLPKFDKLATTYRRYVKFGKVDITVETKIYN